MTKKVTRQTRIMAAEMASYMMGGLGTEDGIGARLISLVIFFEIYLSEGSGAASRKMRFLERKLKQRLKVVEGGRM
jgi:hypothetical protein